MTKFKVGDVVMLKGGSHRMTIEDLDPCSDGKHHRCVWADCCEIRRDVFVIDTVEMVR